MAQALVQKQYSRFAQADRRLADEGTESWQGLGARWLGISINPENLRAFVGLPSANQSLSAAAALKGVRVVIRKFQAAASGESVVKYAATAADLVVAATVFEVGTACGDALTHMEDLDAFNARCRLAPRYDSDGPPGGDKILSERSLRDDLGFGELIQPINVFRHALKSTRVIRTAETWFSSPWLRRNTVGLASNDETQETQGRLVILGFRDGRLSFVRFGYRTQRLNAFRRRLLPRDYRHSQLDCVRGM